MPYIDAESREALSGCSHQNPTTPGELNYVLTRTVLDYLRSSGEITYASLAECIAALECAKLELYRVEVASYENDKARVNGYIYPAQKTETVHITYPPNTFR